MVTKEELRYGNKVIANGLYEGRIMTFQRLQDLEEIIFFTEGHAGEYLKDCDGIPLTPEILEKAGFKTFYESEWQKKYDNELFGNITVVVKANRTFCMFRSEHIKDIQYLHDLQNLIFALTNEELPITL